MAIQNPHDLFLFELSALHAGEQVIAEMLPMLATATNNSELQQQLQHHQQETQQQIQNLEQCFQSLGAQPQSVTNQTVRGLQQDYQAFQQQNPTPDAVDMFILGAAAKTEHFEMACYTGLVMKAQQMGHQDVVRLLQQNLQQEEQMAQKAEQLAQQFGQQMIQPMGDMGQQASSPA